MEHGVTNHPEYQAMMRAVLATPEDDTVRLAVADWLDEHSSAARAEFIRVQVEIARRRGRPHSCFHPDAATPERDRAGCACDDCRLGRREGELLAEFGVVWLRKEYYVHFPDPSIVEKSAEFVRGFVGAVTLSAAAFMGGQCERCEGQGLLNGTHAAGAGGQAFMTRFCPDCTDGRTPGLAAALFAAHPIERVTLSDVRTVPLRFSGSNDGHILCDARSAECWGLEIPLNDRLPPSLRDQTHPTEMAALDALSAALVLHGRTLAGLSPAPE